jgi:hypothetical protein
VKEAFSEPTFFAFKAVITRTKTTQQVQWAAPSRLLDGNELISRDALAGQRIRLPDSC